MVDILVMAVTLVAALHLTQEVVEAVQVLFVSYGVKDVHSLVH
tara:strand:+ start:467 stop:595 length:129 start_codon:yes stop_codon:yes gene_type:complete